MENTTTQTAENLEPKVEEVVVPASETVANVSEETTTEPKKEVTPETPVAKTEIPTATPEAKAETKISLEELLRQHGYESDLELLKTARQRKEQEDKEADKPFEDSKHVAETIDFAAKHKLATSEEFITQKQLNEQKDEVLAYGKFKSEFKAGEDEIDLTPVELEAVIRERFEEEYGINSDNAKLKKAGEAEIKAIADEIRKPLNDKINDVQKKMIVASMHQQHSKAFEEFAKNPQKTVVNFKDETGNEIALEVENEVSITKEEMDSFMKAPENAPIFKAVFEAFTTDREAGDKAYGELLMAQQNAKTREKLIEKIATSAYNKGLEKAKELSVGAKAPFNSKENASPENGTKDEPLRQYSGGKFGG